MFTSRRLLSRRNSFWFRVSSQQYHGWNIRNGYSEAFLLDQQSIYSSCKYILSDDAFTICSQQSAVNNHVSIIHRVVTVTRVESQDNRLETYSILTCRDPFVSSLGWFAKYCRSNCFEYEIIHRDSTVSRVMARVDIVCSACNYIELRVSTLLSRDNSHD